MPEIKRAYFVADIDNEEYGWAVIAHSSKEAKKMAIGAPGFEDTDFINLRAKWKRDANIDDLDYGIRESGDDEGILDDLKRGLYGWIEGVTCPRCKSKSRVSYEKDYVSDGFYCDNCDGFEKCPICEKFERYEDQELCEGCQEWSSSDWIEDVPLIPSQKHQSK